MRKWAFRGGWSCWTHCGPTWLARLVLCNEGATTSTSCTLWLQLDWASASEPTKKYFASEPEGLRQFRDHRWKLLGEENSDLPGSIFCDHVWPLILKQVKMWSQQKGTRQIWIRLVKYSASELSDPSEVHRMVGKLIVRLVKEVKLICVSSIISCSCIPAIFSLYTSISYLIIKKSIIPN